MTKTLSSVLLTIVISGFMQPAFGRSITDGNFKWNKSSVSVCWASAEDLSRIKSAKSIVKDIRKFELGSVNAELRAKIKDKIQEQFTHDKVGFEFTGWKTCSEDPTADILVSALQTTNYEYNERDFQEAHFSFGKAHIGRSKMTEEFDEKRILRSPEEKGLIILRKSADRNLRYPENNLLMVALHEFGHAAGLYHEHNQVDALKDPNCIKYFSLEQIKHQLAFKNRGLSYGPYDANSVMNYCYTNHFVDEWISSESIVRFSSGDTHTLRCLYKPEAEPNGSCEPRTLQNKP